VRDVALELVVDGEARPLALERSADKARSKRVRASFGVEIGDELFDALVSLRVDPSGALAIDLSVQPDARESATTTHQFAFGSKSRRKAPAFVSGSVKSRTSAAPTVDRRALEIDAEPHAIGSPRERSPRRGRPGRCPTTRSSLRIAATTAAKPATADEAARSAFASSSRLERIGVALALRGRGGAGRARERRGHRDERARARLRARRRRAAARPDRGRRRGRFELDVPTSVALWYAAIDASHTSARCTSPRRPWDLRSTSPRGELLARVLDGDTGRPLTARLLVHGIDGTLDPSFGPTSARPARDRSSTRFTARSRPAPDRPLPRLGDEGIEWSIDDKTIDIVSGEAMR